MTRSTKSRIARRRAHKAAKIVADKLTPAEAREKLARWAAAGGDLAHLQRTGEVRKVGERAPLGPLRMTTLADMRARYNDDYPTGNGETAAEAAPASEGAVLREGGGTIPPPVLKRSADRT
jgi:hypothetical protein